MINSQSIILFDGVCNFCNSSINFVIDRDPASRFKFASLQSEAGQAILQANGLKTADFDSIILIQNGRVYKKSSAALEIARGLSGGWSWLYVFRLIPAFVRDAVYDYVAHNRYKWFGQLNACRLPTPELRSRFL